MLQRRDSNTELGEPKLHNSTVIGHKYLVNNDVMVLLPERLRLTSRHCLPQLCHATSVLREQALHVLPLSICLQFAFYILLNACVETSRWKIQCILGNPEYSQIS